MSTLELQNIRKAYPTNVVVKDISLTAEAGEFLTLLGPSGCGKSTILRLIAGLEQPTIGKVLINGRAVNHLQPGQRNISMVFQSYALYPHMTVYDNVASALKLRRVPSAEIQQRIHEVVQFLGIKDFLNRKPSQLSGGQRQRVAVARALVRQPDVFLLDEPLSNLDALLREQVRAELKQLFAKQQAPVVYVTHDQTEAMTLSTRVAVMHQGILQQLDSPQQIYSHPANQFVASFIGSPQMNFLTLPCQGNQAIVGQKSLSLPPNLTPPPTRIILGIRPEHVSLAQADEEPTIQAEVFLVENLGMHNLVSLKLENRSTDSLVARALLPTDRNYASGEQLPLVFPMQSIHWFDAQTGDAYRY
jgi:multiple sugar transport system ATP-binding protein